MSCHATVVLHGRCLQILMSQAAILVAFTAEVRRWKAHRGHLAAVCTSLTTTTTTLLPAAVAVAVEAVEAAAMARKRRPHSLVQTLMVRARAPRARLLVRLCRRCLSSECTLHLQHF